MYEYNIEHVIIILNVDIHCTGRNVKWMLAHQS